MLIRFLINFLVTIFSFFILQNFCFAEKIKISWENFSWNFNEEKNFLIKIKNFSDIWWFQIFLNYDENFLEFKNFENNEINWIDWFVSVNNGEFKFIWDNYKNPISENEIILNIKFKILENEWKSFLNFSDKTKFFDVFWNEILSEKKNWEIFISEIPEVNISNSWGSSWYRFWKNDSDENVENTNEDYKKENKEENKEGYKTEEIKRIEKNSEKNFKLNNLENDDIELKRNSFYINSDFFKPNDFLNRAEAAKIIFNLIFLMEK